MVDEQFARPFSTVWTGTGTPSGSGQTEILTLASGENMASEMVEIGANQVSISIDKYRTGSGGAPTIKYKDGDTEGNCDADIWNTYSGPFFSQGFVRVRVEN